VSSTKTVEKAAAGLAECRKLVDLPLDVVGTLLELPPQDTMALTQTVIAIAESGIQLTPEEVKEAVDLARVIHVMEEEIIDEEKDRAYDLMKGGQGQMIGQQVSRHDPMGPIDADYKEFGHREMQMPNKVELARRARARL
jgi:hypothetical protein